MIRALVFGLIAVIWPLIGSAAEYSGKVVGISDGDTLTLLVPDGASYRQIKVRLAEIDTPESAQPYGQKAKQALSDLAFNKQARVIVQDTDRYGRAVGRVYIGNLDINAELVKSGAAWVYRQYAKDKSLFVLETQARVVKRGLWSLPEAQQVPPWDWRKGITTATPVTTQSAPSQPTGFNNAKSAGSFSCSTIKKRCAEMTSCEEAKFYLSRCGLKTIDGNHDGVPCETLCR